MRNFLLIVTAITLYSGDDDPDCLAITPLPVPSISLVTIVLPSHLMSWPYATFKPLSPLDHNASVAQEG